METSTNVGVGGITTAHVIGTGIGSGTLSAALVTVLKHFQGVDSSTAMAEVIIFVVLAHALAGLVAFLIPKKPAPGIIKAS